MADPPIECDVLVAGAGPAGLTAACLLALCGARTLAVGPVAGAGDTRTTALFGGAERLLDRIGIGPQLRKKGASLRAMRIVDRLSRPDHPSTLVFPASEIGLASFGTNYRNTDLVAALESRARELDGLVRAETTVADYRFGDIVEATLADGRGVRARLVVAADGRGSPARAAAGISAKTWDYGQTALAFQVSHSRPHEGVSVEVHRPGGPLTFIPLPGPCSAVNWLVPPETGERLARLGDASFLKALQEAAGNVLGTLSGPSRRGAFPIRGLSVSSLAERRTVLVGEAAHVIPPIGAQGLNLGFRDAATIAGLVGDALAAGEDPGGAALLAAYRQARRGDVLTRRAATDLLNRSLLFGSGAVPALRGLGLALLAASSSARAALMRRGLVSDADLPPLMRPEAAAG